MQVLRTTASEASADSEMSASERKPRSWAQKRLDRTCKSQGQMILRTKTFGSPKENCVLRHEGCALRKDNCVLRHEGCAARRKSTRSRKGALTTARPLLANRRLTGETCAKNFADTYYTASGLRAESQLQPTKRIIGAEWTSGPQNALHIFSQARIEIHAP